MSNNPQYGSNSQDEVLSDLGKILAHSRPGGASLALNKLEAVIPAASTDDMPPLEGDMEDASRMEEVD